MSEEGTMRLQCRPGDLAKIKRAWNALLVGKLVHVRRVHEGNKWLVSLLGEPALGVGEDRQRFVMTRTLIADDSALEPVGERAELDCRAAVKGSAMREARPDSEAFEASVRTSVQARQPCQP